MVDAIDGSPRAGGVRERKRQETRRRITEAGVRLFAAKGYAATTLDEIASAAGISRRSFFHHFRSKDDILLSLQSDLGERMVAELNLQPSDRHPIDAGRGALLNIACSYEPQALLAIDRLMRSSEAVQARKQAAYVQDEAMLFDALCRKWPSEEVAELRIIAMLIVGIGRISLDTWSRMEGKCRLTDILNRNFDTLTEMGRPG